MRFQGFVGPSYTLSSVSVDCQRTINLYPEIHEIGNGKEREIASLVSTPGLDELATVGTGPMRGLYTTSAGRCFAVSNNKLYEIESNWTVTEMGMLNTTSGHVSFADNGIQIVVVDGPSGYYMTLATDVFAEITDPDFQGADQVAYQDGYFIFNKPDSQQFYISDLNGVGVDALDIASVEGAPDQLVGLISDHRDLWLFGETTTEVFQNTGNADFPFERIQGAFVEHGCAARFSIAKGNNTTFWLGKDSNGHGIVYMAQGYQPQRISTYAVEQALFSYGDISNAVGYTYQQNGHLFYVLNFDDADTTWVFDAATSAWHERTYNNQGVQERHRANYHTLAFSTHIVADYATNKIYALDPETYTDAGAEIKRKRIAPHASSGLKRAFHSSFQLDIESGIGLDGIQQGTDPQAMLRWSDDGGKTWSNEKWVSFGKIGQTRKRALWRRLGASRDRVYEVTISDPVKVALIGAEIEIELAAS